MLTHTPRLQTHPSLWLVAAVTLLILFFADGAIAAPKFRRDGNTADSTTVPRPGYALMGGGSKLDAAFKFLCENANGGDFLVLTADADDAYMKQENEKIKALCPLNSVTTLSFARREDSDDPAAVRIIEQSESIFITGGDQSDYVRFWQDTPVEEALNRHIAGNKPIGGSSAGLAILGEFSFSSMIDTIHSPDALSNPYGNKVTLTHDFLRIPLLSGVITDTHFVKRDRLGRLLVFMARILQDGWAQKVRAIAVEENASVLVSPSDGSARVVGGPAYFLEAARAPEVCAYRQALTVSDISVQRVAAQQTFQLKTWEGPGDHYSLSVSKGVVKASGKNTEGLY